MRMHGANLWRLIPEVRQDPNVDLIQSYGLASSQGARTTAQSSLGRLLLLTGKFAADLTNDDLLVFRLMSIQCYAQSRGLDLLWRALASLAAGDETGNVTGTMPEALRRGQMSVEELVDRSGIRNKRVRQFFIAYLDRRKEGMDYSSLRPLSFYLTKVFWCTVEAIQPGIDTLDLPEETAAAWRKRAKLLLDGEHERQNWPDVYLYVRAMYLDVQEWAHQEPEKWAHWACRSPVADEHVRGFGKHRKRHVSKMHQRTRERAPFATRLSDTAERILAETRELFTAALAAHPGQEFLCGRDRFQRIDQGLDGNHLRVRQITGQVPVAWTQARRDGRKRQAQPDVRDLTDEEERAFWAFAAIETLRHTGIRIEELHELAQFDLIDYSHRTGKVILLRINPSKTDQERIIVVAPELAAVFAEMTRRIRKASGTTGQGLPLVVAYDPLEAENLPPMPMLFQRTGGSGVKGRTTAMGRGWLRTAVTWIWMRAGITGADGRVLDFTPHDFRRIFATDSLSSGMPPHIIAKLLGHESLATTQQYTAIYPDEVITAHRTFIGARRRLPERREEYRPVSEKEWKEFEEHFGVRQLGLGDCMRPYGTSCSHEFACEQCSVLRPDEAGRPRLLRSLKTVEEQLSEATRDDAKGEIERFTYIQRSILDKIEYLDGVANKIRAVSLGMPTLRPATAGVQ